LIIRALAGGTIRSLSDASDTRILLRLLDERPDRMFCGLGGTTFRFLLAWACIQEGQRYEITGAPELLARPHKELIDSLRQCGAHITSTASGFQVEGRSLKGGKVTLNNPVSSQFVSALLLVAPYFQEGLTLRWAGRRLSVPYVEMTTKLMVEAGADVDWHEDSIVVRPGNYGPIEQVVPADWSAAAFFYALAAGHPERRFLLPGLSCDPMQGDEAIRWLLEDMVQTDVENGEVVICGKRMTGQAQIQEFDLQHTPDLFQPLAFLMATENRAANFIGLHNLPMKESDRLAATGKVLRSMGAAVEWDTESFRVTNGVQDYDDCPLPTFNDHRMAMSLVKLADRFGSVVVDDPGVVAKSFPEYWRVLESLGYGLTEA
jgi:3-phosphoshikimate 1-carboxyvinyltransferase